MSEYANDNTELADACSWADRTDIGYAKVLLRELRRRTPSPEVARLTERVRELEAQSVAEKGRADDNYKTWRRMEVHIEDLKEERDDLKARLAQHEGPL